MYKTLNRNSFGFSLIEVMTVIAVIAVVVGLLYAYSDQGWRLFYQSYTRGLSQVKAKLAIKTLSDELREANKNRITINRGIGIGVPLPDDVQESSPYIYFTKPVILEQTGDITAYDYILYYFAKPKEKLDDLVTNKRKVNDKERFLILKSVKFLNQSKFYTEDQEKIWPFQPPILEVNKATLPEDISYIETISENNIPSQSELQETSIEKKSQNINRADEEFLDHYARIKKYRKDIPISGNFSAKSLTDPFSNEDVSIFFSQDYRSEKPIKIKVSLEESPVLFGIARAMTEFEVKVTPRN